MEGWTTKADIPRFQFQQVRLKQRLAAFQAEAKKVSIPAGSIKARNESEKTQGIKVSIPAGSIKALSKAASTWLYACFNSSRFD